MSIIIFAVVFSCFHINQLAAFCTHLRAGELDFINSKQNYMFCSKLLLLAPTGLSFAKDPLKSCRMCMEKYMFPL